MAATFIYTTDFLRKPYKIPNQEENKEFPQWLEDKESEILQSLLGFDLWDALRTGLAQGDTNTRFVNLRDATEYEYGGYTFQWEGMNKMLVPYIYSMWLRESFDTLTNIGVGINSKADFTVINPAPRIAIAQNAFSRFAGGCYNYENSLYGFLLANYQDTYPEWNPVVHWHDPGKENLFDI